MVSSLNQRLKKIIIVTLLIGCQLKASSSFCQVRKSVRVLIAQEANYLDLKVNDAYRVIDANTDQLLHRNLNLRVRAKPVVGGILLGKNNFPTDKVLISTENESGIIIIDERKFKGKILLINNNDRKLSAVNYVDLEDYIKGILYHETSHYWPMQALMAQAIASRSYVVYKMYENASKEFDVTRDIYSQVYGGKTSERYRTNKAVDNTKGKILVFKKKVIPAFFHATCGGYTQDASMLWDIDIPSLKGIRCGFCIDSPHFNWHKVLTLEKIKNQLQEANYKIDRIKEIIVLDKDSSGRIKNLTIKGIAKKIEISSKDFRNIIGPNIIRSTNFKVDIVEDEAIFEGIGWGHGVGLCQWGAYFMAKDGYASDEILRYYYPEAKISLIDNEAIGF